MIAYLLSFVLEGFLAAKKIGIAHRDIKSENFILSKTKDHHFLYKISDFGCGILLEKGSPQLISIKTIIGYSKVYAAPEVIRGLKRIRENFWKDVKYDPWKADTYLLGLVLLQMMVFPLKRKLPPENLFKEKGYQHLYKIAVGMLEKNPDERVSFEQLIDHLKNFPKLEIQENKAMNNLTDKFSKLSIPEKIGEYYRCAKIYFLKLSNCRMALMYALKCEDILNNMGEMEKKLDHQIQKRDLYNLIGDISFGLGLLEKSKFYHEQSYKIYSNEELNEVLPHPSCIWDEDMHYVGIISKIH